MTSMTKLLNGTAMKLAGFKKRQDGGITVHSVFMLVGTMMSAGLAVDFNHMVQSRTQLQGTADAAGHAALYWRWRNSEADAKAKGVEVAELNMPTNIYGNVLASADVEFGDFDNSTGTPVFVANSGDNSAVRVTLRRTEGNSNPINTFMLNFLGKDSLNVHATSVWDMGNGWCPGGEGFFAQGIVDIQSNNDYYDGFCVHSETHVEFQQNNTFEDGVTVSMPDLNDLVVPASCLDPTKNPGLAEALDSVNHNLNSFFNDLPDLIADYQNPFSYVNSDLTDMTVHSKKITKNVTADDIVPGAVNMLDSKGKTLTIDNDVKIENAVVITSCEVKFNSGASIENATMITTDTGSKSISAPSGFRVGSADFCDTGTGGANLITMGDFTVASGFEAFGANIIAAGDVSMTSNANGLAGINVMSGGRIDATANGDLGLCDETPPESFQIPVFKMVL